MWRIRSGLASALPPGSNSTHPSFLLQTQCAASAVGRQQAPSSSALKQAQLVWRAPLQQQQQQQQQQQHSQLLSIDEARLLTQRIKACTRWEQLAVLCERHGRTFNHINLSAVVTHMAQLHAGATAAVTSSSDPWLGPGSSVGRGPPERRPEDRSGVTSTSYGPTPPSASGPPASLPPGATALMDRLLSAATHNMSGFGPRQLANMLWAVARCGHQPKAAWLRAAVASAGGAWGGFEAQHVANMAYALATLGHDPGGPWLERLLQEGARLCDSFKPQELSNFLYATSILLARQRMQVKQQWFALVAARCHDCMDAFNGQELSNLAWAMARIAQQSGHQALLLPAPHASSDGDGSGERRSNGAAAGVASDGGNSSSSGDTSGGSRSQHISSNGSSNGSHYSSSNDSSTHESSSSSSNGSRSSSNGSNWVPVATSRGWMYRLLAAAQQRLHAGDLNQQGITLVLLAAVKLQHRPPDALLRHACSCLRECCVRDGSATGPGQQAALGWMSPGPGYPQQPRGRGQAVTPQTLSNMLVALAHVGYRPSADCMTAFEAAAERLVCASLRAGAGCLCRSDAARAGAEGPGAAGLGSPGPRGGWAADSPLPSQLQPQHLANMLWAMARLRWTPSARFLRVHLAATVAAAPGFKGAEMAQVLWGASWLRLRLGTRVLEVCFNQLFGSLSSFKAKESVLVIYVLAMQRHYTPPAGWLHELTRSLHPHLHHLPASSLARLLHCLACLGHRPSAVWAAAWADAAQRRACGFAPPCAAAALWAAAMLDVCLPGSLLEALAGRVAAAAAASGVDDVADLALGPRSAARAAWALECLQQQAHGGSVQLTPGVRQALLLLRVRAGAEEQVAGTGPGSLATAQQQQQQQQQGGQREGPSSCQQHSEAVAVAESAEGAGIMLQNSLHLDSARRELRVANAVTTDHAHSAALLWEVTRWASAVTS